MIWQGKHIEVDPPRRPKKITGTRFGAILGVNRWSTPFKSWCEITRTYEEPFVDTKYTLAGKTIEPKQAEYIRDAYFVPELITPESVYGKDFFQRTYGDFFQSNAIFGGMWDYLSAGEDGKIDTVYEMKTTKRAEDWNEDIPEYYALQAALYAYLLNADNVCMVCSFLEEKDYDNPAGFEPSVDNTILITFKVSERYPNFEELIIEARLFWAQHVETGISPDYDEKKDADILKELRKVNFNPDSDIDDIVKEAEELKQKITELSAPIEPLEKRLKNLQDQIKESALSQFSDSVNEVDIQGEKYLWRVAKTVTTEIDKKRLENDGLLSVYAKDKTTFRLTIKER